MLKKLSETLEVSTKANSKNELLNILFVDFAKVICKEYMISIPYIHNSHSLSLLY